MYYMSNGVTFKLQNIFLQNFQDGCQMNRKEGLQNFIKIAFELTDWKPKS